MASNTNGARQGEAGRAELLAVNERVAATLGVSRQRVSIAFDLFAEDESGALFGITVIMPSTDRRKRDEPVTGAGATLAEAEAELYARVRS